MSAAIRAAMRRIVIVNPEGGSGKTTIATNLAARCAATGRGAALMDLDPQASSSLWLSKRPKSWPPIHGIAAFERSSSVTRGWQLRVPNECDTQNYVCSAQCGMGIHELSSLAGAARSGRGDQLIGWLDGRPARGAPAQTRTTLVGNGPRDRRGRLEITERIEP